LTLEAVTKAVSDGEDPPMAAIDQQGAGTDSKSTDNPEKKAPAPTTAPPMDKKDLKTTGERVLAENALARIFSSIPHLFLRDIRVRLVVRDETVSGESNVDEPAGTDAESSEQSDLANAEVIVDVGIELLSVTEGDDILSPFHTEESSVHDSDQPNLGSPLKRDSSHSKSLPDNEYLERRIRTGKGSDGGIWMNIVTPKTDLIPSYSYNNNLRENLHFRWARHEWLEATRYCVFRCSGLDVKARIFLGTRKELALATSSYLWSYDDSEAYQGIDHMLYGFDHVVPGPTPHTLPPLALHAPIGHAGRSIDEEDGDGNVWSQIYKTDRNGIQSSKMSSCFHRVSRGMTPTRCTLEHLPCENCPKCWEVTAKRTAEAVPEDDHPLDSYMPMPGLALSISLRDPFEVNLDRLSLDGLGLVIGLFQKPAETKVETEEEEEEATVEDKGQADTLNAPALETSAEANTTSTFSSFFFGSRKTDADELSGRGIFSPRKKALSPAFPAYMKPETIQVLGVYVAEVRLRVHVMHKNDGSIHNSGLSFSYWDLKSECLTLDQQKLVSEEKCFQDMRLDIAILEMLEYKGTERKVLLSLGVPCPEREPEQSSPRGQGKKKRPPWPNTACALLDIPASFESLIHESRDCHGMQLRLMQVVDKPGVDAEKTRTLINCQVGAAEVNLPSQVKALIDEVQTEARKCLGIKRNADVEDPRTDPKKEDRVTQYRAQLDGGRVRMAPTIDMRFPMTRLAGNICPESGFSMETLLERVEVSFGKSSAKVVPTATSAKGVPLKRIAALPESVRLRVLLFVDDLAPLEKALGIKHQASPFLRCHAVNKALMKMCSNKKSARKKSAENDPNENLNRRQVLMNKLLTLDDDSLESLWAAHQKKQRKAKRSTATKKT
jgi:hypothetical protein